MRVPFKCSRGLRVLSWAAIWLVVIALGTECFLGLGYPWRFPSLEPYFLNKNWDDWTHNAFVIQRIKHDDARRDDRVIVLIGGSAGREAVVSDADMGATLGEMTGRKIGFASLCSSDQNFVDTGRIVEELDSFKKTFVILIAPMRFTHRVDNIPGKDYYFLATSSRLNRILGEGGEGLGFTYRFRLFRSALRWGQVAKKHLRYMVRKKGKIRRIAYERHRYPHRKPPGEKTIRHYRKEMTKALGNFKKHSALNFRLLRASVDAALENGDRVILLNMPSNPHLDEITARFSPDYDEMVSDLVQNKGVGYLDLRRAADWKFEDFLDVHHLRASGQGKFVPLLTRYLADHINAAGDRESQR